MRLIFLLAFLVGSSYAQLIGTGTCPTPKPMNFPDLERLATIGSFFPYFENPYPADRKRDCANYIIPTYADFKTLAIIYLRFNSTGPDGNAMFSFAPAYCGSYAVYNATFSDDVFNYADIPVNIIGTDYANWAVFYMCNQQSATVKEEYLYITSVFDNQTMAAQYETAARASITAAGLDGSVLVPTNYNTVCNPPSPPV